MEPLISYFFFRQGFLQLSGELLSGKPQTIHPLEHAFIPGAWPILFCGYVFILLFSLGSSRTRLKLETDKSIVGRSVENNGRPTPNWSNHDDADADDGDDEQGSRASSGSGTPTKAPTLLA